LSEELENSLQQAIDSYMGDRLRAIDDQLSQLQSDFAKAVAQLREQSSQESVQTTSLAGVIAAHLQTAREQKLAGATTPDTDAVTNIKRSAADIERQQSQTDVLSTLLRAATQFADRVALFVIRNDQAIGWRECEANDPANVESIGGVRLSLTSDSLVTRAVRSQSLETATVDDRGLLVDQLGGDAQSAVAVPLVVRGKVVAVLYADSPSGDQSALNTEALELLVRVSAMAVNLLASARAAQAAVPAQPEAAPAAPYAPTVAAETTEQAVDAEHAYTPQVESQVAKSEEPAAEAVTQEIPTPVVAAEEPKPAPLPEPAFAAREEPAVPSAEPPAEPVAPGFSSPLGASRRYGVAEPELPVEVGEEERRLHNDARRFARLLVSEIKLYNEQKVKDGRSGGDLYDRLREDIDRSRQMYNKRVAPPVAARHDYFHQELVNTLAEGDPGKLGVNYPGAAVVS